MVEQVAEDYAKMFRSLNPGREINPLCVGIEDMLARLDEFEQLLSNVRTESNMIMENHVSSIVGFNDKFKDLRERIDNLEQFVGVVNGNVDMMEKSLDIAEEELNISNYSLKGLLLKPLLGKTKYEQNTDNSIRSNLKDGEFNPIPIFNCDEYFGTVTPGEIVLENNA